MSHEKYGPEVVEELYSQFGDARQPREVNLLDENDKGELPEMTFYRHNNELMTALAEFSLDAKDEEVQEKVTDAREKLRSSFRVLVARTLASDELDKLEQTRLISFALKDKDEDRTTAFRRLFPDGLFTEMPLDHDQLILRIGSMVLDRSDTISGRLGIVDELTEQFTKLVSSDVREAFAIELDEEEPEEEKVFDVDDPEEDVTAFFATELRPEEEKELDVAREWEL